MGNISKVKSVQASGHFDGKFGRMFKFDYVMEDGKSIQANHKTDDGFFKTGTEVEYSVTRSHEQYGDSGKVSLPNPEYNGGGGAPSAGAPSAGAPSAGANSDKFKKDVEGSKAIEAIKLPSYALSYAKDLIVPISGQYTDGAKMAGDVIEIAKEFLTFLKSNQ
tara:strand:- start:587 stop:1075 length:489 start_codon:yes stop_codon:yes gene_type:complete